MIKAYIIKIKNSFIEYLDKIVLIICFFLVFGIGYYIGINYSQLTSTNSSITVLERSPINYTEKTNNSQVLGSFIQTPSQTQDNCANKIKGNINSKGEKIYHLPTGAYYKNTNPEACFETEEQAISAGFRKSGK
jgi:hypothetical protein